MATATNSRNGSTATSSSRPVFSRRHRRLQVAVWQNDSASGSFFNTSLQRSYKDGDDWKRLQTSLNREDLLPATKLLNWAHSAIVAASTTDAKPSAEKQPISSQRYRNLEASVWRNESAEGPFFTASLKRSYKVDDEWNDTSITLGNDDLLPMARLLDRAHDAIDDLYEDNVQTQPESHSSDSGSADIPF